MNKCFRRIKKLDIQKLRNFGRKKLIGNNVEDSNFKSEILLQHILNMDKTELIINSKIEVQHDLEQRYISYLDEIIEGKPIQYITHKQEFMGLYFYVDENVLIPQPDTEILVEKTIRTVTANNKLLSQNIKILDLCTGSGAIAVSLENYLQNKCNIEIYASDISEKAIDVAKRNAKENNAKVKFIISDMFQNIEENNFDIIVSNPPYIEKATITTLSKEVQNEPHLALDGGIDGLDFYRIIAKEGYKHLKSGGYILVEIGYNQKESVSNIFKEYVDKYIEIKCVKDLNGQDRVIEVKRR